MELATVAFAALNLMTYTFWWRKPLNVERPFRVQWKEEYRDESEERVNKFDIWGVLRRALLFPLIPFDRMARGDDPIQPGAKRVPTFYPGRSKKLFHWKGALAGIVVATIFGGIHCIAWNYQFLWTEPAPAAYDNTSNPAELFLWRIACLIITVFPVFIWGLAVIIEGLKSLDNHFAHAVSIIPVLAGGICGLLYVLARITLPCPSIQVLGCSSSRSIQGRLLDLFHTTCIVLIHCAFLLPIQFRSELTNFSASCV